MLKAPLSNVTVEVFVVCKHLVHVADVRCVPGTEVSVKFGIREGPLHVVDSRHIPSR